MNKTDPYAKDGDPTFWDVREASADIKVSAQILRRAVRDNKLPAKRLGNRLRFVPADVRRYADTELEDA